MVEGEVLLQHAGCQCGVAKHKAVTIAGEAERYIQQLCVSNGLLHASLHGEAGFFGLDHSQRDIGFQKQHIVCKQHGGRVAPCLLATHHHTAGAQRVLGVNLVKRVPPGLHDGRADDLVTQVAFGKVFVVVHGTP